MHFAFKKGKKPCIALILTIMLAIIPMTITLMPKEVNAQGTELLVLPAESNFTIDTSPPGTTFTVNITVMDIQELANWQISLAFDTSMLNFTSASIPSDNVLAGSGQSLIRGGPIVENGTVTFGATYIDTTVWTFNGTGTVCQLTFAILPPPGSLPETSSLHFANPHTDTFLLDGALHDIAFTDVDGTFNYGPAVSNTQLLVIPAENNFEIDTSPPGTTFTVNITVMDVMQLANWQIALAFDPTMLNFTGASVPSDNVLAGSGQSLILGGPTNDNGTVTFGATYIDTTVWSFNGTGTVCQLMFAILPPSHPLPYTSPLDLTAPGVNTFLLDGQLHDISFTDVDGTFNYGPTVSNAQILVLPAENNFTTNTSPPGTTFTVNITVSDVMQLANWQISLSFDQMMLNFTGASIPSDNVFAGSGQSLIQGGPTNNNGTVTFGATYIDTSVWTFNGTGTLCQLTFAILPPPGSLPESSLLDLVGPGTDTFILDGALHDITFTDVDGTFNYTGAIVTNTLDVSLTPTHPLISVFGSVLLQANVTNGTAPYTYTWDINGVEAPEAFNAASWTFQFNVTDSTYYVRVNVTDSDGAMGSAQSFVSVTAMTVTLTPASTVIDVGSSVTFDVSVANGVSPFNYEWWLNGTVIPAAANMTEYAITFNDVGTTTVQVNVTGSDGKSQLSAATTVTILPPGVSTLTVTPVTGESIDSNVETIGDTVVYNITVQDVSRLGNWQINMTWDGSLLNFSSATIPTDNIFAGSGQSVIEGLPIVGNGYVTVGATILDVSSWSFNGSGILCQITLQIIHQPALPASSTTIGFEGKYTDTFLLAGAEGATIPFNITTSSFTYNLIETVTHTVGTFTVTTFSNASILTNNVTQLGDGSLQFNANGANGTAYFVNVTIPTGLLAGIDRVTVNGVDVTSQATITAPTGGNIYVYYSSIFGTESAPTTFATINLIPEGLLLLFIAGMIASIASVAYVRISSKRKWVQ